MGGGMDSGYNSADEGEKTKEERSRALEGLLCKIAMEAQGLTYARGMSGDA